MQRSKIFVFPALLYTNCYCTVLKLIIGLVSVTKLIINSRIYNFFRQIDDLFLSSINAHSSVLNASENIGLCLFVCLQILSNFKKLHL